MKTLSPGELCERDDCMHEATELVYSRNRGEVIATCERCGETVLDEGHPEYHHTCENCGCGSPIN